MHRSMCEAHDDIKVRQHPGKLLQHGTIRSGNIDNLVDQTGLGSVVVGGELVMLATEGLHSRVGEVDTVLLGRTLLVFLFVADTARLVTSKTEAPSMHSVVLHEELLFHLLVQVLRYTTVF